MGLKALILLNDNLSDSPTDPTSPFYKALNTIAKLPGDELTMTTGYHSVGTYRNLGGENFVKNVNTGFSGITGAEINLLAGKYLDEYGRGKEECINFICDCHKSSSPCQPSKYRKFYHDLLAGFSSGSSPGVAINAKICTQWHSKVTFKLLNSKLVAMVIGSSNLSKPALTTYSTSNMECDLFIFDDLHTDFVRQEFKGILNKNALPFDRFKNAVGLTPVSDKFKEPLMYVENDSRLLYLTKEQVLGAKNMGLIQYIESTIKESKYTFENVAIPLIN